MLPSNKFQKVGTFRQCISQIFQRVRNRISPHLIPLKTTINSKFVNRFVCLKMPNLIMFHRIPALTSNLLQFFLFTLKYDLEQIVAADQIGIKVLFGQNYTLFQDLLIHHILLCAKDHLQLLERVCQEQRFRLSQQKPILKSREDVDCLIVSIIEMISDVSTVTVPSVSGDQYLWRGQFVVYFGISGDTIDPIELSQEKRVGVHPHSTILVYKHHSEYICSKLNQFLLCEMHHLVNATHVDVFGYCLFVQKPYLPAAFLCEKLFIFYAQLSKQRSVLETLLPVYPQDLWK